MLNTGKRQAKKTSAVYEEAATGGLYKSNYQISASTTNLLTADHPALRQLDTGE